MKMRVQRIVTLVTLVAVLVVALSAAVYSEDANIHKGETYRDVVLVLDCSGSMLKADPYKLCATACKLLVDQIPLENARIAIIAYGYNGGSAYSLQNYSIENPTELNLINVVTPLQETASLSGIDDLKKTIDTITEKRGNATPTGTALLCAADLLEKAGSTDENACIVLIGDGECTSNINVSHDVRNVETAVRAISAHGWPVFALQVNSDNIHDENSRQTRRMQHLAYDCGSISSGYRNEDYCYFNLTSFEQGDIAVSEAASNIFAWVANSFPPPEPVKYELPADITYDVPNLASEFNITLLGEGLRDITIAYPDGKVESIDGSFEERNLLTSIIEGRYYNIKLFCPTEGQYTVHVGGNKGNVAVSLDVGTMDTNLKLESDPKLGSEKILKDKNTKIHFSSNFFYRDISILDNHCYEDIPAAIEIEGTSGKTEIPMTGNKATGYSVDIVANEIASYGPAFTIRAVVKGKAFADGYRYSNPVQFKLDNVPPKLIDPNIPDMSAGVNKTLDIDLKKYFENPDNDKMDVVLECLSDTNKQFDFVCENDVLKIETGIELGRYELKLKVKDYDMMEYLESKPFALTINEEPFVFDEIDPIEIWVDSYPWQDAGSEEVDINLADYYYDPDGIEAQYRDFSIIGKDTLFKCEQNGVQFKFTPIQKGTGSLSFVVSDQMTEKNISVEINVVSGKAVFWERNWIWFLIAAIVIVVIVIVLLVLSATTRVKGNWTIELTDDNGGRIYIDQINIASNTTVGNKAKKVNLLALIEEISFFAEKIGSLDMNASRYDGINKIVLKGVTFGNGFTVTKIPENVKAEVNGLPVRGSKRVKLETMRLVFDDPTGVLSRMCLTMRPH